WDISIIDQKILNPASYREFETEVLLKTGLSSRYGLGVQIGSAGGHRMLFHDGEVSGFTAQNIVLPHDRGAIAVVTHQEAVATAAIIGAAIRPLLLASADPATPQKLERARKIFADLQAGRIDRSLFTDNANSYFSEQALQDFASSLAPLGSPKEFIQISQAL